jgi:2'-5' RNA ligase
MEPVNLFIPGYQVNEYLLILKPHEELWNRILRVKDDFARTYKAPGARLLRPHLALVSFSNWSMMEEKILHRLQTVAMGTTPFKVELKDYGCFPTHTIYLNVTSRLPIQRLVGELKESQRLMRLNAEHKPRFVDEPHIAIARKLKPWQYEGGWNEYAHRQFTGRFIADSMLLLKRPAGTRGAWQIAKRFEFQNLPVTTKQGSLFA